MHRRTTPLVASAVAIALLIWLPSLAGAEPTLRAPRTGWAPSPPVPAPSEPSSPTPTTVTNPITAAKTPATPAATPDQQALTAAAKTARTSGRPTRIDTLTTATSEVVANPDGTYTATTSVTNQRIRRNNTWIPVDTTLTRAADGTIRPAATTASYTLNPGGTGPAATIAINNKPVSLALPVASLPKAVLVGNTATYPNVWPDTDLVITASDTGFSTVLVVKNATAAANPILATTPYTIDSADYTLTVTPDGGLQLTDPTTGAAVTNPHTPITWDSRYDPATGPKPTATNPGDNQRPLTPTTPVGKAGAKTVNGKTTGPQQVTLATPASALTGPDVVYPVYVDPGITVITTTFWRVVRSNNQNYGNDNQEMRVGRCVYAGCTSAYYARGYARFPQDSLPTMPDGRVAQVLDAAVRVQQNWSGEGNAYTPITIGAANSFTDAMGWPGEWAWDLETINTWNGSGTATIGWQSTAIRDYVQYNRNNGWSVNNFVFRSDGPTQAWKRLAPSTLNLTVTYYYKPVTPNPPTPATALLCNGAYQLTTDAASWQLPYTDDAQGSQTIYIIFSFRSSTNPLVEKIVPIASGATATVTAPPGWRDYWVYTAAYITDPYSNNRYSDWSTTSTSAYSNTTMPTAATIRSFDFPNAAYGNTTTQGGTIYLDTTDPNTAGYTWSVDGQPATNTCPTTTTATNGRSGTLSATPGGRTTLTLDSRATTTDAILRIKPISRGGAIGPTQDWTIKPTPATGTSTRYEAETTLTTPAQTPTLATYTETDPPTRWSNGQQSHIVFTTTGQSVTYTLPTITTAQATGTAQLQLTFTTSGHYGTVKITPTITRNNTPVPLTNQCALYNKLGGPDCLINTNPTLNTTTPTVGTTTITIPLQAPATPTLKPGDTITITITSTTPPSPNPYTYPAGTAYSNSPPINDNGNTIGIDYIRLITLP